MTYGFIVRDAANTPRTISAIQVRDATNTPRDISQMWVRDSNNTPRMVFSIAPPMAAVASPSSVSGTTFGTGTAATNNTTVTPSGGTPPYTYAWQLVSYDAPVAPTASPPNGAVTSFVQTGMGMGDSYAAIFQCVVTDSTPGSPLMVTSNPVIASWIDLS